MVYTCLITDNEPLTEATLLSLLALFTPPEGGSIRAGVHPVLKREDRLRKHPFAGFGTVMEDIIYQKLANLIGVSLKKRVFCAFRL